MSYKEAQNIIKSIRDEKTASFLAEGLNSIEALNLANAFMYGYLSSFLSYLAVSNEAVAKELEMRKK